MPVPVHRDLKNMLEKAQSPKAGLCIPVLEADPEREAGRPTRGRLWNAEYEVAVMQLIVAALPWIIW